MFRVLSETEKRELEAAKKSVKSNSASAILYVRAGLVAEAERELNVALQKESELGASAENAGASEKLAGKINDKFNFRNLRG